MDKREKDALEQRRTQLAWYILELKFAYYYPSDIHPDHREEYIKPDHYYDTLEDEYRKICGKLGAPSTACDMVGFSFDRPSCRLVVSKLTKGRNS